MAGTVIGPGTHLESGLRGKDDITIEGRVDGPIVGEGAVTLAAGAEVGGDVWGREVTIGCKLQHKVHASFAVHLLPTAEVYGDLVAPRITVDDGAVLEGQVKITRQVPAQTSETQDRRAADSPMRPSRPTPPPAAPKPALPRGPREIPQLPVLGRRAATREKSVTPSSTTARARARLLELLTQLSYEKREVILASGKPSDFYIDCKQAALTAEGHHLVGTLINELLAQVAPEVRAIGGLTMGADPIASAAATVSWQLGRPIDAFYVRKEPKGHGTQKWIEGDKTVPAGTPVAIVEDVCTTGGSAIKAIERARLHGLEVKRVIALVDREEGGREAIEREAPFTALFRRSDFLK